MKNSLGIIGGYAPVIALVLLLVLVFSGKIFRESWKAQGPNWQIKCWISGLIALGSFMVLAFVPL